MTAVRVAVAFLLAAAAGLASLPIRAQTLINIRTQDAPRYDPHHNTSSGMGHPMFMMGDTLVALDWDLKTVKPLLATSWTMSADGLTYTFKLRDDVTFCSGKKLTADDVIYSFTRLADPAAKYPFHWRLGEIDALTAPDPYTVIYKLKRPHAELLVDLTNFAATIINKENVEALGADFGVKGFDGTGPLCWEAWEPRKELVLKRHGAYKWGPTGVYKNPGPVKYERMIWRIVPEETTRMAAMLAGQADFCHWNPLQAIDAFRKAPHLAVYEPDAYFGMYYFGMKSTREYMRDRRVRAALSHVLDRDEINKALFFGQAQPARSLVHEKAQDFNPATLDGLTRFDPAASRKLLDEAGWELRSDGFRYKDGKKLELLLYSYTVGENPKLSEVLQGAARKIGIDIKVQMWDPTAFFQKIAQQDYDIWTLSVPYTSAGDQMYLYYHSNNRPAPNRTMWADPVTDKLLDAGRTAVSDADRRDNFYKVQQLVHDEALMLPTVHSRLYLVAKKSIKGARAHGNYAAALYKGLDLQP
ncbi:ABC transporter substrate-binding protein [Reyranella sp. CPCC 100927]|uniref:ABC transporter substrate-binding protein n=1 Tax=Reyranella sp. CPCC 100927 TaxID=2599616 RepID=UPI0011B5DDEF|nr:ABC transporter substrate-binding protein [Reyranella sp. CPCC 100927]TWT14027.1 ABC transporter substrate-binding protein [Reyranella sp. CPCC 100927]